MFLVKRTGFSRIDTQATCEKARRVHYYKTREMPEMSSKKRSFLEFFTHLNGTRPVIASLRHSSQTWIGICLFRKQSDVSSELLEYSWVHQSQSVPKWGHSTKSRRSACRLLRWSSNYKKSLLAASFNLVSTTQHVHEVLFGWTFGPTYARKKADVHVGHRRITINMVH